MDVLSEVLSAIHLDGAVYVNGEFTAPWCIQARYGLPNAKELLGRSDHFAFFHFLLEGECQAKLADRNETFDLKAGDLVLIMDDYGHMLGSDVTLEPQDAGNYAVTLKHDFARLCHGGGGAATRFVCGYIACDPRICRPLLNCLPAMFKVTVGDGAAPSWLAELLRVGVRESVAQEPGARSLLTKIAELLFVEALRRYSITLDTEQKGWLAGLRDPVVGKALAKMHGAVSRSWTLDELAREVALSRSALSERFLDLIGESPMQYLTRWRLALAARSLRSENESIARVAERSGYESEAAFNRAFKREFGMPPAAWRKHEREFEGAAKAAP